MRFIIGFCMIPISSIALKGKAQTASIPRELGFAIIAIRNGEIFYLTFLYIGDCNLITFLVIDIKCLHPATITPCTSTNDTLFTFYRTSRICLLVCRISPIPVGTPFPNITAHIIKMQFVRSLRFNRMRGFRCIKNMPSNSIKVISPAVRVFLCFVAAPCRKFPLGLSW